MNKQSKTKHDIVNIVASILAQTELIKRSSDYKLLSKNSKDSLDRLASKTNLLHLQLKSYFEETESK